MDRIVRDRAAKDELHAQFARIGRALANPHRVEILDLLAQGERSVEVLASRAAISVGLASAHLQAMRQPGAACLSRRAGRGGEPRGVAGADPLGRRGRRRCPAGGGIRGRPHRRCHLAAPRRDRGPPRRAAVGGRDRGLLPRPLLRARAAGRGAPPPCRTTGPSARGWLPRLAARRARPRPPHPTRQSEPAPPIYLDYNASTPIHPRVAALMRPLLDGPYANPSAIHSGGRAAHVLVERARAQVADLLGCGPDEIVFTSGGSEADNLALKGVFFALKGRGDHIITTAVEHPAILEPLRFLEPFAAPVTLIPVDR